METLKRHPTQRLESRWREAVRRIFVVAGPRQMSKTTAARQIVLQNGDRICALEVKSTAHNQSARKGMRVFAEKHERLNVHTAVLGGDDFALADALTQPARHWLEAS